MEQAIFSATDFLLPSGCDNEKWSVVACDQFTSEPEYWDRVADTVGDAPSTLRLILPEAYFSDQADTDRRIAKINETMSEYCIRGLFTEYTNRYLYLERMQSDGKLRRGLIGKIDLEAYSYATDSRSAVRPTEGTVESRLPPRMRIRENAPLELPHVMMLIDDPHKTVIEPLSKHAEAYEKAYDFTLMEQGGYLRGWIVSEDDQVRIDAALSKLFANAPTEAGESPVQIAVGDGNHSLATAKACFERLKAQLPENQWRRHPARFALVELENLHDEALVFEPIHRVVFGVRPKELLDALSQAYAGEVGSCKVQELVTVTAQGKNKLVMEAPPCQLAVGSLQRFLDAYITANGGEIDYIHGEDVAQRLAQREDAVAFLLSGIEKSSLFLTVRKDGALPRKTFSMGHASDKRYYLEARRIK